MLHKWNIGWKWLIIYALWKTSKEQCNLPWCHLNAISSEKILFSSLIWSFPVLSFNAFLPILIEGTIPRSIFLQLKITNSLISVSILS